MQASTEHRNEALGKIGDRKWDLNAEVKIKN
jgi:hypothetical protein